MDYVQVRFPGAQRWVTVAVSERRPTASSVAADASRELRTKRGETLRQILALNATQPVREGGDQDITPAATDFARQATR